MPKTLSQIGEDFHTLLSEIVSGGDDKVPADANTFVSWCMPGLPFEESDLQFCAKGIGSGTTAEEEKSLLQQAYALATLIDYIPDPTAMISAEQQDRVWRTSQARMSQMYGEILRQSRVADETLTPETIAELERLRGLLTTTRKKLAGGEDVRIDSPVLDAYNEYMAKYITARTAYNNKRIAANAATGAAGVAAVNDFALNGGLYQMQATNADNEWKSKGYKNDVNEIYAKINDITGRSAKIWKQRLMEQYEESKVRALGPGQEFFYTTLIPGNFVKSQGWQNYEQTHEHKTEKTRASQTSWKDEAGVKWKLAMKGSASGSSATESEDVAVENFKLSFEFTQVVIARPYFAPEFFLNRGWTLEPGHGWMFDQLPSDGESPPQGLFVAYPTTLLFARNIVIESADLVTHVDTFKKSFEAGGSLSVGLFSLSGSYAKSSSGRNFEATTDGNKIIIPGMTMLGSVNQLLRKTPNPMPDLVFSDVPVPA